MASNSDSLVLASCGKDIKIHTGSDYSVTRSLKPYGGAATSSISWSQDCQYLASACNGQKIVVFEALNQFTPMEIANGEDQTVVIFSSNPRFLGSGGKNGMVYIWDLKHNSCRSSFKDMPSVVCQLAFNHNNTNLAAGCQKGRIVISSLNGTSNIGFQDESNTDIVGLQYSCFKKHILTSISQSGALTMWDTAAQRLFHTFTGEHKNCATGLRFSPVNEMLLVSIGLDCRITFYDARYKKFIKAIEAGQPLTCLDFLNDGFSLALGTRSGSVIVYDLRKGSQPLNTFNSQDGPVVALAYQMGSKYDKTPEPAAAPSDQKVERAMVSASRFHPAPSNTPKVPPVYVDSPMALGKPTGTSTDLANTCLGPMPVPVASPNPPSSGIQGIVGDFSSHLFSPLRQERTEPLPLQRASEIVTLNKPGSSSSSGEARTLSTTASTSLAGVSSYLATKRAEVEAAYAASVQRRAEGSLQVSIAESSTKQGEDMSFSTHQAVVKSRSADPPPMAATTAEPPRMVPSGGKDQVFDQFQIDFFKRIVEEELDDQRWDMHQELVNLQVEMIRQFHIQQNELKSLLKQFSYNDEVLRENARLQDELRRQRCRF